jgi:hypothetical protein
MILSYNVFQALTPSDTVDLPRGLTQALWVGSGGDVAAVSADNRVTVFAAVPAGSWLPIAVRRVNASGSTSTGLVALYQN